jgi:hypothetical protein
MSLAGGAALFAVGCGAPPEETSAEQQPTVEPQPTAEPAPAQGGTVHQMSAYTVCWPALGIYEGPGTSYPKNATLSSGSVFYTDSTPFSANGDWWVRGTNAPPGWIGFYGYVRWDGLCH